MKEFEFQNEVRNNYYIFNTYFFTKLRQIVDQAIILHSDKNLMKSDNYAYLHKQFSDTYPRMRKWQRGMKFFDTKYVIIPINKNEHWSVLIICNLPALKAFVIDKTPLPTNQKDKPCMLYFDSLMAIDKINTCMLRTYIELELNEL